MAYLILINQHCETDIDQVLVVVKDDYDEGELLDEATKWMTGEPFIAARTRLDEPLSPDFSPGRPYIG